MFPRDPNAPGGPDRSEPVQGGAGQPGETGRRPGGTPLAQQSRLFAKGWPAICSIRLIRVPAM